MRCSPSLTEFVLSGLLLRFLFVFSVVYGDQAVEAQKKTDFSVVPFGSGGQLKMIYDRRQRPQAVYINDKVYIVYNGGAPMNAQVREKT